MRLRRESSWKNTLRALFFAEFEAVVQTDFRCESRKVFEINVTGKKFDFVVNEMSPLYRILVRRLADAGGDIEISLVRTGTGKSTKYDVKET